MKKIHSLFKALSRQNIANSIFYIRENGLLAFIRNAEEVTKKMDISFGNAEVNRLFVPGENKKYIISEADINPENINNSHSLIVNCVDNDSTVLDVGCSYGYLGSWLVKNKKCRVYGIDINPDALNYARNEGCYERIFLFDMDNPKTAGEEFEKFHAMGHIFDFAICADVLEHLKDPTNALAMVAAKLKPGGKCVVSIPNISNLDIILNLLEGRFNYSEFGILDNTHLRFFTKRSFAEWINSANAAFGNFKLDLEFVGSTRYISEFVNEIRSRYPTIVDALISISKDFEVMQNIFILTKIDKHTSTRRLDEFLSKSSTGAIGKIQNHMTGKVRNIQSRKEEGRIK